MAESQNFANVVFSTGQEEILIEEVRNNPATMLLGGLIIRDDDIKSDQEIFNVQLVQLSEPIIIKDESTKIVKNKNVKSESNELNKDYLKKYNQVLDVIFPPREWEENGITWRQVTSRKPPSQNEHLKLNENFESQISYWNIQTKGLTPIRKELYGQYFDEQIRQVYLNDEEMGELLMRIRNELKITVEAYIYHFENGVMFSVRKSKIHDQEMNDIEMDVKTLKENNLSLEKKLVSTNITLQNYEKYWTDQLNVLIEKNKLEFQFLTRNHEALQ
ncbi:28 kDa inner dynein arm light chain, axonemal-like, partial [Sipha flava]|uniref:28 kDa inner dynein arm light chain, axonemal-like n=1 Tax=Sipha flava TaxID=143950 RepID=A0A8B8FLE5_9HEMI